jgi:hypothetical protein
VSGANCLTDDELRRWPYLPKDKAVHHRTCSSCGKKVSGLTRPRFVKAAEKAGALHGKSAQEVLDQDLMNPDKQKPPK